MADSTSRWWHGPILPLLVCVVGMSLILWSRHNIEAYKDLPQQHIMADGTKCVTYRQAVSCEWAPR